MPKWKWPQNIIFMYVLLAQLLVSAPACVVRPNAKVLLFRVLNKLIIDNPPPVSVKWTYIVHLVATIWLSCNSSCRQVTFPKSGRDWSARNFRNGDAIIILKCSKRNFSAELIDTVPIALSSIKFFYTKVVYVQLGNRYAMVTNGTTSSSHSFTQRKCFRVRISSLVHVLPGLLNDFFLRTSFTFKM